MQPDDAYHVPVMRDEVVDALRIRADGCYLDGTAGGGGHVAAILDKLGEGGRVVAVDRDEDAQARLADRFAGDPRVVRVKANFAAIGEQADVLHLAPYDGILFDFGVSSHQIDRDERGFSFMRPGPLDMRMDRSQSLTAADVVNGYREGDLVRVLSRYGEEPKARRLAAALVNHRPFHGTAELTDCLAGVVSERERTKVLARVFQALRIEVNGELDAIERALRAVDDLLAPGGRLVTLAYHSLEDRRVKRYLRDMEGEDGARFLALPGEARARRMVAEPRKAQTASAEEIERNPRARSVRMRVGVKPE